MARKPAPKAPKKRRKTTAKATDTAKGPAKVPQPHGGALNAGGTPGNKGGTGRPPKPFKSFVAEVSGDPVVQERVRTILTAADTKAKDFKAMLELVWAYAQGRPKQAMDLRTSRTLEEILSGKPAKGTE